MNIAVFPVLFALTAKLLLIVLASKSDLRSSLLYTFIVVSTMHNLSELLVYINGFESSLVGVIALKLFYSISFYSLVLAIDLMVELTGLSSQTKYKSSVRFLYILSGFLILMTIGTGQIVAGSSDIGYSITAVRGNFYWLFQIFSMTTLLFTAFVLLRGYKFTSDPLQKKRCFWLIFGFGPNVLIGIGVVVLMALNVRINASIVYPISTTFFLLVLFIGERSHHLTSLRKRLPGTLEKEFNDGVASLIDEFTSEELPLKDAERQFERLLVIYAYYKYKGNINKIANVFGIGRSSL